MSQKSSVPQAFSFVSQVLKRDRHRVTMTFESPIKRYEYYADRGRSMSLVANEREFGCRKLVVD